MPNENVSIDVGFDNRVYNALQKAAIDSGILHVKIYIKVIVLKSLKKKAGGKVQSRPPKLKKDLLIQSTDIGFTENIYKALEKASETEDKVQGRPPKFKNDLLNQSIDIGFTENIYKALEKASETEDIAITEWIRRCVLKGFS